MSDISSNPYQSPQHEAEPVDIKGQNEILTDKTIGYLKAASPWLRFMAVIGFIGCGCMVIGGIVMFIAGTAAGSVDISEFLGDNPVFESFTKSVTGVVGFFYIGAAVITFFPSLFTWKFGTGLRTFNQTNSALDLENALKNNKSLWKYNGILTIVSLAAIPVILIFTIIITVIGLN